MKNWTTKSFIFLFEMSWKNIFCKRRFLLRSDDDDHDDDNDDDDDDDYNDNVGNGDDDNIDDNDDEARVVILFPSLSTFLLFLPECKKNFP